MFNFVLFACCFFVLVIGFALLVVLVVLVPVVTEPVVPVVTVVKDDDEDIVELVDKDDDDFVFGVIVDADSLLLVAVDTVVGVVVAVATVDSLLLFG